MTGGHRLFLGLGRRSRGATADLGELSFCLCLSTGERWTVDATTLVGRLGPGFLSSDTVSKLQSQSRSVLSAGELPRRRVRRGRALCKFCGCTLVGAVSGHASVVERA